MKSLLFALLLSVLVPTFASGQRFQDKDAGFSVTIPEGMSLAWIIAQGEEHGLKAHVFTSPISAERTYITVLAKYPVENLTNQMFLDLYQLIRQQFYMFSSCCVDEEEDQDVLFYFEESLRKGDNPGERYRLFMLDDDFSVGADLHVFVENHHILFVFTGLVTNGSFGSLDRFSSEVVNSLEFWRGE